jgi:hypothetical protein
MAKKKTVQPDEPLTVPAPPARRRTARRPGSAPPPQLAAGADGSPAHEPLVAAHDTDASPAALELSYDQIAEAAYHRYLQRGGQHGQDFDDWLEAERSLRGRR